MNKQEYIDSHIQKKNKTECYTTMLVIQKLKDNNSIVFTKFGDGEYYCMAGFEGANCDGDQYNPPLANALRYAFLKLCDLSYDREDNRIVLGRWHYPDAVTYCSELYWNHQVEQNIPVKEIPFVNYHLIYNDDDFNRTNLMYEFVSAVQKFSNYKVLITNTNNIRLETIFQADQFIPIQSNTWHTYQYEEIRNAVDEILKDHLNALVLIAGGLASKVLIAELCEKYKQASFLDIGSGFDILATKRCTRDHKHSYEDEVKYYYDLLPENFHTR